MATLAAVDRQQVWVVNDKRLERLSYGMLDAVAGLCERNSPTLVLYGAREASAKGACTIAALASS
jgi:hypothetical protein